MEDYPNSVTRQCHIKILEQMNNSFFDIKRDDKEIYIGLFCNIKYKNNNIPVILLNNYINNKEDKNRINKLINTKYKEIELDDIIYTDINCNITIIKLKEYNKININKFVEIDEQIFGNKDEMLYKKESIYIIQYNDEKDISISYGLIKEINKDQIIYTGKINSNYKFSFIFNLSNNKLIGINHNSNNSNNYFNRGFFLKNSLHEFIFQSKHKYYKNTENEINILINVEKDDINKEIYFLDNYQSSDNNLSIDNLTLTLNELNTELYINDIKHKYKKYYKPEKEGINKIKLKFNINIIDCSYMFARCKKIIDINFVKFNTKNIIYMEYMFFKCHKLKTINLFCFDTVNVKNMEFMFYKCKSINNLDLSSFVTKNVNSVTYMFYRCNSLNYLDLSGFDTRNVNNMAYMFSKCYSLNYLSDISEWDTKNVTNMDSMFDNCKSLKSLSDISKWNTKNVSNMSNLFFNCESLTYLPDISNFDTNKVTNMGMMFSDCKLLQILPDISKWNTQNVTDMSYMFNNCYSLNDLPNISKWNTKNITDMSFMFSNCKSLIHFPDISRWYTDKSCKKSGIFDGCNKKIIPKKLFEKFK